MPLSQEQCTAAIARHSAELAQVAEGNLEAPVTSCPGWLVRDLVHHVTNVQWFWATIVEERLSEPPDDSRRPADADDGTAISALRAQSERLVRVLGEADPAAKVWTWAPAQQDVAFVFRHQVQEVVVHHWDAAHAARGSIEIDPDVAADAIAEFLRFSVPTAEDPDFPEPRPTLGGSFALRCSDAPDAWVVRDGPGPGLTETRHTTGEQVESDGIPAVTGTAGQLLLWLYKRRGDLAGDADQRAVEPDLVKRFRALSYTD